MFFRVRKYLLLLVLLLLGAVTAVDAAEPVRTFRVGAYNNPPKIYKDNNDQPAGVFVDILNYIAQKENWKLEYVFASWDTDLQNLQKGEIDIMPDVALSSEREKIFDFTKVTVLNSWAVVYVRKDSAITSVTDLNGKRISIFKSSVYENGEGSIDQYLNASGLKADIVEVGDYRTALDLLELGKVDVAVVSHVFGVANQANYHNIKATQIFLKPTELRFALTKGAPSNAYLTERIDYWVAKLKSGDAREFNNILEKYGLGELENEPGVEAQEKAFSPLTLAAIAGGLIVIALIWFVQFPRRRT